MSILARDWAYSQALAAPAKFVLVALAEHVSGEGRACWPSVSRLARMTGYAERTVRRALRALEAAGLVRIKRRPGRPALYSLNLSTTISVLVTDEIARDTAAKGGYSGTWPPEARTRPRAAEIARQAVCKRHDIIRRQELARHARRGETWEDVEQRLARAAASQRGGKL